MSWIDNNGRITVSTFASIPPLPVANLPPIHPAGSSIRSSHRKGVNLSEGCFVTKTVKYTHELAHMVNAVRAPGREPLSVEDVINDQLRITPVLFNLSQPCNLIFLDHSIHASLDRYGFVAITASLPTLNKLIQMVRSDNDRRQQLMDSAGICFPRFLNFKNPSFSKPEYQLVVLHPEHFLPLGSALTIYDPNTRNYRDYIASTDRCIRESRNPTSPCLPSFHHASEYRTPACNRLNVFLVIINADIKFRRYFDLPTPPTPLPVEVIDLMRLTMELVDLLYWMPTGKPGLLGTKTLATGWRKNPPRTGRPDPARTIESSNDCSQADLHAQPNHRSRFGWLVAVVKRVLLKGVGA